MRRIGPTTLALLTALFGIGAAATRLTLVICAPGFPGNTAQAQPSMDSFARAAEQVAKRPAGSLAAVYHETAEGGLARIAESDTAMALVPLPFFLRYGDEKRLRPKLQVVQESGGEEIWSLVAKRGAIHASAALAGWEVTGTPGYAPAFIRGPALGEWGALPQDVRITFTSSVLSSLRRAAAGEKVAVLLDRAQTAALASLPFAADMEVVARSKPLPGTLLCAVSDRLDGAPGDALLDALLRLHEQPYGAEILKELRMVRFEKADLPGVERARKSFAEASSAAP
jgi:phosphonate ABC transporter substrate-binding protein